MKQILILFKNNPSQMGLTNRHLLYYYTSKKKRITTNTQVKLFNILTSFDIVYYLFHEIKIFI